MDSILCVSFRFLQSFVHARNENGDPEWPPSPLRVFQAVVNASASRWNERRRIEFASRALRWLEMQGSPEIVGPVGVPADVKCQFYVPDNTADLLVPAWKRGELTRQVRRTEKVVRPTFLRGSDVHYLYPLADGKCPHLAVLTAAARSITHLGWGIDMATGDATVLSEEEAAGLEGHRWQPSSLGSTSLRVPIAGTLDDLMRKHEAFLNRLSSDGFRPVSPLKAFRVCRYRRDDEPTRHP